jgi:Nif-specific regulatory protein
MISAMRVSAFRADPGPTQEVLFDGLYELSRALVACEPDGSLEAILDLLTRKFELRAAALVAVRDDGEIVLIREAWTARGPTPALLSFIEAAARRVHRTKSSLVVESAWVELVEALDAWASWRDGAVDLSLVAVPVRHEGAMVGCLAIAREHSPGDQAEFLFDADVTLLGSVANLLGLPLFLEGHVRPAARPNPPPTPSGAAARANRSWELAVQKARVAAGSNVTVLLRGETGTGKTLLARLVHESSPRRGRPFIEVNCAALAETLLEGELFGHEKGAFTGAVGQRPGRFELADGGTLFLDEIGELSQAFQAKLLRVLQLGEFERVGGSVTHKVDVRLIAATHRDLEAAVRNDSFRADLYYRLCVVPIQLPPLRERRGSIPELARDILQHFNAENATDIVLDDEAIAILLAYPFPGNVRELENVVRRAASFSDRNALGAADFEFLAGRPGAANETPERPGAGHSVERERLLEALTKTGWVIAKAARLLGRTPRQVAYAIHKQGITLHKL